MKAAHPATIVVCFALVLNSCLLLTVEAQNATATSDTRAGATASGPSARAQGTAAAISDGETGQTSCETSVTGDGTASGVATAGNSTIECGSPSTPAEETEPAVKETSPAPPEQASPSPTDPEIPDEQSAPSSAKAGASASSDGETGQTSCETSVTGDGTASGVATTGNSTTECESPSTPAEKTEPAPREVSPAPTEQASPSPVDTPMAKMEPSLSPETTTDPVPSPGTDVFCEIFCMLPALHGNAIALPEYCDKWCIGYETPDRYLDPDAICTMCPEETCSVCRCATGECMVQTSDGESDTLDMPEMPDPESVPFCSRCRPWKQCRSFWFCCGK